MSWWELGPQVAIGLAWLVVPGAALAWALGLRRWPLLLATPALSVSAVSAGAVLAGFVGVAFTPLSAAVSTLPIVVAALACRLAIGSLSRRRGHDRTRPPTLEGGPWFAAGAAVGGLLLAYQVTRIMSHPGSISQSYDVMFHLNAVRFIADTGWGSSLLLGRMVTDTTGLAPYPAAWHDFVYLIWAQAGGSIPQATNAFTVHATGFVWPASLALLGSVIGLPNRAARISIGVLAAGFGAFPALMLKWGILYPNLLGYAALPALMAALVLLVRPADKGGRQTRGTAVLLVAGLIPGLVVSHPNSLLGAIALALPLVLGAGIRMSRGQQGRGQALAAVATLAALLVMLLTWLALRPGGELWAPIETDARAFGEFLTNAPMGFPAAWLASALMGLGIWAAFSSRQWSFLAWGWLVTGLLWVVAAGVGRGTARAFLVGGWYGDPHRLAALTAIAAVPLTALGVGLVGQVLTRRLAPLNPSRQAAAVAEVALAVLLTMSVALSSSMASSIGAAQREFKLMSDSLLITEDEQAILDKVDELVPPDSVILVNPWDGSPLAYALEGRRVTQMHSLSQKPEELLPALEHLSEAKQLPEVCQALREANVHYYLDFVDTLNIGREDESSYEGLEGAPATGVVTPVFVQGEVGLYRITACD